MKEIEYKWILEKIPELDFQNRKTIKQGYFSNANYEIRIRETYNVNSGDTKWIVCHKEGLGLVREETEEEVSRNLFQLLWPLTINARIEKTRMIFFDSLGLKWEIDEYYGLKTSLVSCELEIPTVDFKFTIPPQIADLIKYEVTGDVKWLNSTLARNGIPF